MDVSIPDPNEGLAGWFMSADNRRIMDEIATKAGLLAQAEIHKRTGALTASVNAHVEVGGHRNDRYVGEVTIGNVGTVDYGASYVFGTNDTQAHHVADAVLGQLEAY